ncbi:glycosyltransferase [Nostocoides sp. HKS02]|uniref:glycosyltransferase n=1 Tax=Nostocoides sp. HKS02 TaxID=1813880 RepID=UPI0012B46D58|nr:glycosyltransferase [Tetrasphaera sp. HKS02]QGN59153.1 glycosyltransferase [Tetrasphaera sp. HKS02]
MTAIGPASGRQDVGGAQVTDPDIVIATIMREVGGSGVQSHVETLRSFAHTAGRPTTLVTPFSASSPLLRPVFAARLAVRLVSRPAGVWWYRHWHGHYLGTALSARLRTTTGPAVVYAQDPVSASAALAVRTTEPVVMVVHFNVSQADEWADKGELPRGGRTYASIRALEEDVLPRLDGLVYVSQFMRSVLEDRMPALRALPGIVIPNCVAAIERPASEPVADLVTVGALEPRKNQGYLLEVLAAAAQRGHRYSLTVIGDGPDRGRLERQAARLGLTGQVSFAGYQADPRRLMAGHRLYCHTARMESFGIALVEAMSEGLPVLAAPVGGIPEVVRPGVEGGGLAAC